MIAGTIDKIKNIEILQSKCNYNDRRISNYLGMNIKELRAFRLNNKVFYNEECTKENNYLELAIRFQELANEVYFPVELARLTNTSPYTTNMICKMFDVKPSKKAYCATCNKELVVKSTAIPKFCNSSCRYKYKGVVEC
ncbi:MAG: hypothetical protein ACRCX2_00320 [Paraclostridium sp.]